MMKTISFLAFILSAIILSGNASFAQWTTSGSDIYYFTGKVGIGTSAPTSDLSVESGSNAAIAPFSSVPNGSAWIGGSQTNGGISIGQFGGNYGYIQSRNKLTGYGGFRLLLNPLGGNVGIGTTSPTEKLSVKGKIRAQEIKVELTDWADYVFAKDYKLPTLEETERHIMKNGHLPGIPSAAEVAKNGVELGEMNKKLLQKIEELTLHLIEMEKRVKELEQKVQP